MVKPDELYDQVISLSKDLDAQFLELGVLLRDLQETDSDAFRLTAQNSGIGLRKAYYLVNIHRAFGKLKVPAARLRAIGWTKLNVISSYVTKQNVKELLKLAEENTVRNLERRLKGDEPENNAHAVLMYFSPDDYEKLASKLVEHGAVRQGRGLQNKEQALRPSGRCAPRRTRPPPAAGRGSPSRARRSRRPPGTPRAGAAWAARAAAPARAR